MKKLSILSIVLVMTMAFCMMPIGMLASAESNKPDYVSEHKTISGSQGYYKLTGAEDGEAQITKGNGNYSQFSVAATNKASEGSKAAVVKYTNGSDQGFVNFSFNPQKTDWSDATYFQFYIDNTEAAADSTSENPNTIELFFVQFNSGAARVINGANDVSILKLDTGKWESLTIGNSDLVPGWGAAIKIPAGYKGYLRIKLDEANWSGLNSQISAIDRFELYTVIPNAVGDHSAYFDDFALIKGEGKSEIAESGNSGNSSNSGNSGNNSNSGNSGNNSESGNTSNGNESNTSSKVEEPKMPADYTTGHKTISDKQGYYKLTGAEESDTKVQAFAIGVGNCQFSIETTAKASEGSKAAKVKYTNGSEHGWVNIGFNPSKTDWSDATYIQFYVDNTEAVANASDLGEPNPLELFYIKLNGNDTYRIAYGADDISFLNLEKGKWETMKVEQCASGINAAAIKIPAGYKGYLRIRLSEKNWGTLDAATLSEVTRFELYTLTPNADGESSAYFDDFALIWGEGKTGASGVSLAATGDNSPVETAVVLVALSAAAALGFVFLKRKNSAVCK